MNWKAWWQAWRRPAGRGARAGFNPFRVLLDGNRRRDDAMARGTSRQMEMRLHDVKPVRNSLFDDDVEVVKRSRSRLIYETPGEAGPAGRKMEAESDRAWERLRGRRLETLRVGPE